MASTSETGHAKNVANFQNLIAFVKAYGETYNPSKEALKIHYGASEARNIRGSSTAQEEEMLKKEGVPFAKIPVFPTENSKS